MNKTKLLTMSLFFVAASGCLLAGTRVESITNGYVYVTHTGGFFHLGRQYTLQYRPPKGSQRMVWPDVMAAHVRDQVAVFGAWKAEKSLEPSDDRWPMILRIFAVKAPEPPLDITSEVIRIWCKESHYDYAAALARASIANTEEKADALEFTFAVFRGEDWPNTVVRVSWLGISEIMREVKEHGVVRKDHRYGTKYVEKMPLRESKKQP